MKSKNEKIITIKIINEMETKDIIQHSPSSSKTATGNRSRTKSEARGAVKQQYGQFYTTNYEYIFQNMDLSIFFTHSSPLHIVEPFVGKKHLIEYLLSLNRSSSLPQQDIVIETYDIDPKNCIPSNTLKCHPIERDTIMNPPKYKDKFVLTNPPYLARNKSNDKKCFDKYEQNDIYKCFIETLIQDPPIGGLIIIPLNFWCSIQKSDINLRKRFVEKFETIRVNVFEESVFQDTSYTVCSILFISTQAPTPDGHFVHQQTDSRKCEVSRQGLPFYIYPSKRELFLEFKKENNWSIGGEIYQLHPEKLDSNTRKYKIYRLLQNGTPNTKILLKALDDDSKKKICLRISEEPYYGKNTSRTYASIIIEPPISLERQIKLVDDFNHFIESMREKYHSLFLTNYRESKDISRKRISFELVYDIIHYLLVNDYK